MYLMGSSFSSSQQSLCIAQSGCSAVAIRYLSSPSPAHPLAAFILTALLAFLRINQAR